MLLLATKLKLAGLTVNLFAYSVTFESWKGCIARLERFIDSKSAGEHYIMIGHSLGSVLTRAVIPNLSHQPKACFFLAPPAMACQAAQKLAPNFGYRLLTGEMGQLLANQSFMSSLPILDMPTFVYAGDGGMTGTLSPFGNEPNDGILSVMETRLPNARIEIVPSLHTLIMNNRAIAESIIQKCNTETFKP